MLSLLRNFTATRDYKVVYLAGLNGDAGGHHGPVDRQADRRGCEVNVEAVGVPARRVDALIGGQGKPVAGHHCQMYSESRERERDVFWRQWWAQPYSEAVEGTTILRGSGGDNHTQRHWWAQPYSETVVGTTIFRDSAGHNHIQRQ